MHIWYELINPLTEKFLTLPLSQNTMTNVSCYNSENPNRKKKYGEKVYILLLLNALAHCWLIKIVNEKLHENSLRKKSMTYFFRTYHELVDHIILNCLEYLSWANVLGKFSPELCRTVSLCQRTLSTVNMYTKSL